MRIVQEERCCVDQDATLFLGHDFETPENRARKRFRNRALFVRVFRVRAIGKILLDEQNLWSDALELHQVLGTGRVAIEIAEFPAVQSDVVRTHARRE